MAKTVGERMKEMRERRKALGLVEFRCWVTPKKREQLRKLYNGK